ncbi:TetR family transcriptional regulator [Actinoplanes sp. M2I2]|uniref:TetR family transcriptional regulator n=1 Tax=Actinoplanes sp. M2I2 TaxID=1734444 RepID=UPI002021B9FF|nr:TetR family transcriptional regulator [Actinoplanes sp. M2I2]
MPPDATDTKRRLLRAAVDEFARSGLAGARVDRIAEAASANKRSIYMHFGTKEELFDMVVGQSLLELAEAVPFDAARLPRYAGELFSRLEERPHVRRLALWAALERPQPIDVEVEAYRAKIDALEEAQAAGRVTADIPAVQLMAMVLAIVTSWDTASWSLKSLRPAAEPDRRAAVEAAVAGFTRPRTGPSI